MKILQSGLIGLFVCSLITACSSTTKKNDIPIGEPNNTILEAGIIEFGKSYSMKIDSIGDIDWYGAVIEKPGYFEIATKTVPENLKIQVRFAYKEEWESNKEKWETKWMNIPATIKVTKADTLYFAIIDDYNDAFSDEAFEFKAEFIDEFDPYEPNNTPEEASDIPVGEVIQSAIFPIGDADWFKLEADITGYFMLRARTVPEGIKPNVRFAKKQSEFSPIEHISKWKGLPAGIQINKPGTYYIEMIDDYNDAMSREMMEWKIDFISEMDTTEPNNSFEEGYTVAVGDTVRAAIFPVEDSDFFKIKPERTGTVQVGAKGVSKDLKLQMKLFEMNDFKEKAISKWEYLPAKFDLEEGKEYYLQLVDDYNDAYSEEPFELIFLKFEGE